MNALTLAESRLLAPTGLDASALSRAFDALLGPGIDFGDLYFQHARREAWSMEDGIVKDGSHSIEQGVGVRAISGEKTGFAYSDELDAPALLASAQSARAIARDGRNHGAHLPARVCCARQQVRIRRIEPNLSERTRGIDAGVDVPLNQMRQHKIAQIVKTLFADGLDARAPDIRIGS